MPQVFQAENGIESSENVGVMFDLPAPRMAMTTNQIMRTGPNMIPIPDVPLNWMANSAVKSPIVIGMTVLPKAASRLAALPQPRAR